MTKKLKQLICALTFIVFTMTAQAQQTDSSAERFSFKIDDAEFVSNEKSQSNDPSVIGPDLYIQMGELSTYSGLSTHYTFSAFESYIGNFADDFIVPEGGSWTVKYARYTMFNSSTIEDISAYNVIFYKDNGGKPGDVLYKLIDEYRVVYEERAENAKFNDVIITLSKNLIFSEGKYWISIQAIVETETENSYYQPDMWAAAVLQKKGDAIYSQGHIKNPGQGYFQVPNYSPMSSYWEVVNSVDYGLYNYNFALYGIEKNIDLAVTSINTPETGNELTDSETVMVTIQNHGLTDAADNTYKVRFRVNEGAWSMSEDGFAVSSGAEILYKLHSVTDLSVKGVYNIEVELIYAEDEHQGNNILVKEVENFGILYPAIPDTKIEYTTCEGTFTDHGGLDNCYVTYSNDTVVFMPGTERHRIRLEFYDTGMTGKYGFDFFNGSSTDAPHLGHIQTQEIHNLVIEGTNSEGALTIIVPGFDLNFSTNNFLANITCVQNVNTDFRVEGISTSKKYSWETETIELTAHLLNQGLVTSSPLVTFFVDGTELNSMVSTTTMEFGEKGTSKILWTPPATGNYTITAKVPADGGSYPEEKEFTINHEILPLGAFVEGFEGDMYPPEGWTNKMPGGSLKVTTSYNFLDNWEGYHHVFFALDTLITPKLDIQETDTLKFLYSAGFFGTTLNMLYAPTPNGPWEIFHVVNYYLPFTTEYNVALKRAAGQHYIAFVCQSNGADALIDFVRGPQLYFNEFDLVSVDLTGEMVSTIDTETSYEFKVRNMGGGTISGADYSVKLWKETDGISTELISLQGVDITQVNYHTFTFNQTFTELENGEVYATIEYSADEEPINNTSESLPFYVIKSGSEPVYVGDPLSTEDNVNTLRGGYGAYSESLYYKESLNCKGEISGITFYVKNMNISEFGLKVFIAETDAEDLSDGYFSTSALDEVFSGTCEIEIENAYKPYHIHFDKPFIYSGEKNLVIAFHKYLLTEDRQGYLRMQSTEVGANINRGSGFQEYEKYTDVSNPVELNKIWSKLNTDLPNIKFYVKTTEMNASLVGNVTDKNTTNLEGVLMSLYGYANTTHTNVDGNYSFPVMPYGDIDITTELHGYFNQTKTSTFTSNTETVVDFVMEELPAVQVTGNVIANDSLKPLASVEVYMTGYDMEFFDVTDAEGNFVFDDVLGDKKYEITYSHPQFISQTITVSVLYENFDVGTVTLDEIETSAFNVIAEVNDAGNVNLNWQTPYSGIEGMVDPTLGVDFGPIWWNEPNEDVQLGNLFKVNKPGTVTDIQISTLHWEGAVSAELQLRFYSKDQIEIGNPVPFTLPDSTTVWMNIPVPDFTYTDDFYVMVHWDRIPYSTQALRGHLLPENVSWIIDGNGKWNELTDFVGEAKSGAISIRAKVLEEGNKASKALISYDLWRTNVIDISFPERWDKINTEPIAETSIQVDYTDETFADADPGFYMYAVKANYTNASSPYTYSNDINKSIFYGVTVNVTSNNQHDITGAIVTLSNENGTGINTYIQEVSNGKVVFPRVYKGHYNLLITKGAAYEAYESYEVVNEDTIINTELIEVIFTPTMLDIQTDTTTKTATFTWGLGEEKTFKVDDGSAEKALGIQSESDAQIGNFFSTIASGQITSIDILGVADDGVSQQGKVSLVFYNASQEIIEETDKFILEANEDGTFFNVPTSLIPFNGSFYVMVKYSSGETQEANSLAMDIDENPGNAFYYDDDQGFSLLANFGYWGNFMIRANTLVNGKKSATVMPTIANAISNNNNSDKITVTEISKITAKANSRSVLSYNIFLNDMTTPVAKGVTSQYFVFNENDHLTEENEFNYTAAVQAVFVTGSSFVVPIEFDYENAVGVLEALNSKIELYPNPANSTFTIANCENSTIEIYNIAGKIVKVVDVNSHINNINVSNLSNGTYIVKVKVTEGSIYRNLIINR